MQLNICHLMSGNVITHKLVKSTCNIVLYFVGEQYFELILIHLVIVIVLFTAVNRYILLCFTDRDLYIFLFILIIFC